VHVTPPLVWPSGPSIPVFTPQSPGTRFLQRSFPQLYVFLRIDKDMLRLTYLKLRVISERQVGTIELSLLGKNNGVGLVAHGCTSKTATVAQTT